MDQHQMLIALTSDWESHHGTLHLYECGLFKESFPVVFGEKGMAFGIGLHPLMNGLQKKEGDLKSPAGIFSLGPLFGYASSPFQNMDYIRLTQTIEAIDDPLSRYYNQIVDSKIIQDRDWQSSEKMGEISVYELGCVINHNFPNPMHGAGSAIFLHIWNEDGSGTAGCTAMSRKDLLKVLHWLDRNKQPKLVQLPLPLYLEVQESWDLPKLSTAEQKRSISSSVL